jgi:hypothetical protein
MAGLDGLVFAIFVVCLVLVALRVAYLWARERRTAPASEEKPKIPLRYRVYALAGVAAGIEAAIAVDFRYTGLEAALAVLVAWLLRGIESAFLWLRRDERPPGFADRP